MNHRRTAEANDTRRAARQRGFSILEMLVVISIIVVIAVMATIELQPTWQQVQANAALDQMKGALRQARELAISQRRTIVVKFGGGAYPANSIQAYQLTVTIPVGGGPAVQVLAAQPLMSVVLPTRVNFMTFGGEVDTPDAYGIPTDGSGLYFNGANGVPPSGVAFHSDGTFTNGNGIPISGTVFMGITGIPTTERAVTILGATGRVHGWRGTGGGWFL